jgi:DNA ligase (NAD+)
MTDEERQTRIKELEGQISKARGPYYNGIPIVSDDAYDAWVDELAELDTLNQVLAAVGAPPVSEWLKVRHSEPMGSLDKVNTLEEMTDWIHTRSSVGALVISEKLDGISVQVRWVGGKLVQAVTRGDGSVGEDITANVRRMQGIPGRIPKKSSCSVRGEIILRKSDHEQWFKADYANTRNAAAGIAKRYDGRGSEHLSILFYKVMSGGGHLETEEAQFRFIESIGLQTPGWYLSELKPGVKTPHDIWVDYQQGKRDKLDYDIDGLVVAVNDLHQQFALGEKDLRPLGAVAFKFASLKRETKLRKITPQTGGTGRITPVGNFDPVSLLGATVTNASLYNWKYIAQLGLDVGATILVARANDVIPRVVAVVQGVGTVAQPPTSCSSCGAKVVQEGEFHVCPNRDGCPAQVIGRVSQWISNLGILEWGDVLLEKLTESGMVKSIPDLYRLTEGQLASLERMGPKGAAKALANLHEKKVLPLELMLGSLSIPGIAVTTVKLVMDAGYDDLPRLRAASLDKISKINGMGPVKAEALSNWIRDYSRVVEELASVGVTVQEPIRGKFSGMSFCFTGEMAHKRGDLEEMVKTRGGEVKNSVTKKLAYLVLADTSTNKAVQAKKYGTKCLSEDEFLALVGE